LAEKETAMTTIDILYLAGIIGAFVVFAVVLAWVQFQTRHFDAARLYDEKEAALDKAAKDAAAKPTVSARWPQHADAA
jgi:hypothetical protein